VARFFMAHRVYKTVISNSDGLTVNLPRITVDLLQCRVSDEGKTTRPEAVWTFSRSTHDCNCTI